MKPLARTALLAAGLAALAAAPARADDAPGRDWIPIDRALAALSEAGYTDVRGLEADDGVWEGKAVKDGWRVKVTVDPRSGAVAEKRAKGETRGKAESDDD